MQVVRRETRRISTTPNGAMTTLASPTLGHAGQSLWLVRMESGARGPEHAFTTEVLWSLTEGSAELLTGDGATTLAAGDTVVLPAGEFRRFVAGPDGFTAVATSPAPTSVRRPDGSDEVVPPWVC